MCAQYSSGVARLVPAEGAHRVGDVGAHRVRSMCPARIALANFGKRTASTSISTSAQVSGGAVRVDVLVQGGVDDDASGPAVVVVVVVDEDRLADEGPVRLLDLRGRGTRRSCRCTGWRSPGTGHTSIPAEGRSRTRGGERPPDAGRRGLGPSRPLALRTRRTSRGSSAHHLVGRSPSPDRMRGRRRGDLGHLGVWALEGTRDRRLPTAQVF